MLRAVWRRHVQLPGRVLQRLPLVAEPDANHFPVKVQLVGKLRHLRAYRHTRTRLMASVRDYPGKPVPER